MRTPSLMFAREVSNSHRKDAFLKLEQLNSTRQVFNPHSCGCSVTSTFFHVFHSRLSSYAERKRKRYEFLLCKIGVGISHNLEAGPPGEPLTVPPLPPGYDSFYIVRPQAGAAPQSEKVRFYEADELPTKGERRGDRNRC